MLLAAIIGGTSLGNGIWPWVPWAWPVPIMVVPALKVLGKLPPKAARFSAGNYSSFILALGAGLGLLLAAASTVSFGRQEVD